MSSTTTPAAPAAHAHEVSQATTVPTGRLGIWMFLASEIVIFGGLITTYVLYRLRHAEWGLLAHNMVQAAGAINTLVLLTSSLTMVLAHAAVEHENLKKAARYMLITVALGAVFMGIKAYEYGHEIGEGFTPVAGLFWSFYFAMTGLHALHVLGGMFAILAVRQQIVEGRNPQRVELVGIYWHFVDIVWIFLFPLLYLAN